MVTGTWRGGKAPETVPSEHTQPRLDSPATGSGHGVHQILFELLHPTASKAVNPKRPRTRLIVAGIARSSPICDPNSRDIGTLGSCVAPT